MVASPEESGRIVAHENVYFYNGNHKRRCPKLVDEMRNAERRTLLELASKLGRLNCSNSIKVAQNSFKHLHFDSSL